MRNGLLVGLGAIAALPELAGTARAANADVRVAISVGTGPTYSCQADWWYCVNCFGIYHSDDDTAGGVCPHGGNHQNDTSYFNYCIPHGGSNEATDEYGNGVQLGWRWCYKCQGLFWGSAAAESWCPDGQHHVVTSTAYVYDLPYGQPQLTWEPNAIIIYGQPGWLYCGKCRGLFFGHGTTSGGVCPYGGAHSQYSGSSNYCPIEYPR